MILIFRYPGACYYAVSKDLTVDDYQGLVDRGWRRYERVIPMPQATQAQGYFSYVKELQI